MILVTPELNVPLPTSMTQEQARDLHELALRAFHTVEFLEQNGAEIDEPTDLDRKEARSVFLGTPGVPVEPMTPGKALVLKALLEEYDVEVVRNAVQVRNYVKLRLLELSDSKRESTQLKALELLGKMADVQAFSDKLEISVTHQTTAELEAQLAEKLSSYMKDIVDMEDPESVPAHEAETMLLESAPAVDLYDVDGELGDDSDREAAKEETI